MASASRKRNSEQLFDDEEIFDDGSEADSDNSLDETHLPIRDFDVSDPECSLSGSDDEQPDLDDSSDLASVCSQGDVEMREEVPNKDAVFVRSRFRPDRAVYNLADERRSRRGRRGGRAGRGGRGQRHPVDPVQDMIWYDGPQTRNPFPIFRRKNSPPFGSAPFFENWSLVDQHSPFRIWSEFIDKEIIDEIVRCTNIEAHRVVDASGKQWVDTDEAEIHACIGLLYLRGVHGMQSSSIKDMFSSKPGQGLAEAPLTIGRNRFENLLRFLRFDEKSKRDTTNAFAPMQKIFDRFVKNCRLKYVPRKTVTVDESMADARGRCPFIMYLPSKPCKYGIKIWCVNDTETKYLSNAQVYHGKKGKNAPKAESGLGERVVMELTGHLRGNGRTIGMDNYFTSIPLAEKLYAESTYLLGTIKAIRKGIPKAWLAEDMGLKESRFIFSEEKTLVRYKTKKAPAKYVILLSTKHHEPKVQRLAAVQGQSGAVDQVEAEDGQEEEEDGQGEEDDGQGEEDDGQEENDDDEEEDVDHWDEGKPEIILSYNKAKGGVDSFDQMIDRYKSRPISRRWPVRIFCWILDAAALNAGVIYMTLNPEEVERDRDRKEFRRKFIIDLAYQLMKDQQERRDTSDHWYFKACKKVRDLQNKIAEKFVPKEIRSRPSTDPMPQPDFQLKFKVPGKALRCAFCPRTSADMKEGNRTTWRCTECQRPVCQGHWDKLLCPSCAYDAQ